MRLKELINDLTKRNVFGKVVSYTYVAEFQKRDLPHAHILLILAKSDKIKSADLYSHYVSAEIPNPITEPILHRLVTSCMLHRCNSHCKKNNSPFECSKRFPKPFSTYNTADANGFPIYKRRSEAMGGLTHEKDGFTFDNSRVVPYNRYLILKYNAHINVEACSTIAAVKYLFWYLLLLSTNLYTNCLMEGAKSSYF